VDDLSPCGSLKVVGGVGVSVTGVGLVDDEAGWGSLRGVRIETAFELLVVKTILRWFWWRDTIGNSETEQGQSS